jgi:hypothetical protein
MALAQDFSMARLVLMLLMTISTVLSTAAFWLFIIGIPALVSFEWFKGKRINDRLALMSFFWLVFLSVAIAFSMVHFEMRYALPVIPAALVGIVYILQRLSQLKIFNRSQTGVLSMTRRA